MENTDIGKLYAPVINGFLRDDDARKALTDLPGLLLSSVENVILNISKSDILSLRQGYSVQNASDYFYDLQYVSSSDGNGNPCYFVWLFDRPLPTKTWNAMLSAQKSGSAYVKGNATHTFASNAEMTQWATENGYHMNSYYVSRYIDENDEEMSYETYRAAQLTAYKISLRLAKTLLLPQKAAVEQTFSALFASFDKAWAKNRITYGALSPQPVPFDDLLSSLDDFVATDITNDTLTQAEDAFRALKDVALDYLRAQLPTFFTV